MLELTLYGCHSQRGNQQFVLRDDGSIYHPAHDKCIDLGLEVKKPLLVSCNGEGDTEVGVSFFGVTGPLLSWEDVSQSNSET